jgi:2-polyprenyl-3-methyl-5-hydroxy-6-metoxy-1,4-benzoquinol methylase/Zn ribbon nucleic-acid-binding protein
VTRLRETDIRPDELMAEQARRYAADVAWLMERRERFVEVACPACEESAHEPHWRKYGLDYRRCLGCGSVYVSPRPDPELLDEYYRSSSNYEYWNTVVFPASEDARRERIFRPRAERAVELAGRHGAGTSTLVDVGAGYGTFCEEVRRLQAFERVVALEPEPHLAATCRAKGLEVIEAPVEQAALGAADVLTSFEVLEHLFSPQEFVQRCASVLRPGGLLMITCPNVHGFDVEVLGEASATVDAEHLNYLHPASLGALVERCGFEVVESQTPGRLDAELVRKKALSGEVALEGFLRRVLLDEWDRAGDAFQDFLAANGLSSNMWLVARRREGA